MLSSDNINEAIKDIKSQYGIVLEQKLDLSSGNITKKLNPAKSVEDTIEKQEDKKSEIASDPGGLPQYCRKGGETTCCR
jgi:hypothetical protein